MYARLARRCAEEPIVDELVEEWTWDVPLRLFGGVHYLVLAGVEPDALSGTWDDFRTALESERDFLSRFVAEQGVQTNEVQRCFALLPAFLTLAGDSEVLYQISEYFHPEASRGVRWNDPAFGVVWPDSPSVISDRDSSYPDFDRRTETG